MKRKEHEFPEISIHSRIIIVDGLPGFLIYEHYDTWFLRRL